MATGVRISVPAAEQGLNKLPATVVFGARGFIGSNLLAALRSANQCSIGAARRPGGSLPHFDLNKPDIGTLGLKERGITHAVIAAGVSRIAACERDPGATRAVNVDGTVELARQLRCEGMRVAVISSDYVFDGTTGDYDEGSAVRPVNEYGRQKADLEQQVLRDGGRDVLVIRLGKVFDTIPGSGTLLDEMAGRLLQRLPVAAAADQIFCPTCIDDVVRGILLLLASRETGIAHLCAPGKTSRYRVAEEVARAFGCDRELIREISLRDLGEPFQRPCDTSMICRRIAGTGHYRFRTLASCIEELKNGYDSGAG